MIIEIIGCGFDASTDDTDDHVLWVEAPSLKWVQDHVPAELMAMCDELDMSADDDLLNWTMPGDLQSMVEQLTKFKENTK